MEFNQGGRDFAPRPKFQGNWQCANCKGPITELPFEPDAARLNQLLCRNCHRDRMQTRRGGFGR